MIYVSLDFITGVAVGFEYVEVDDAHFLVFDLFIVRIFVEKTKETP